MSTTINQRKIAVVTGASRGIGKSIALHAAEKGLNVVITYNQNAEKANEVVKEITTSGGNAAAIMLDTGDMGSVNGFAARLKDLINEKWKQDKIEYLVNNAGIAQRSTIENTTEAIFDELVNVNFKGTFFLTRSLMPMISDGGQIINISSGLARFSFPGTAVYGALKAGLEALTRYFAKEYAARKIRVNTIAPGAIDTEFGGGKGDEQHRAQLASAIALGRLGEAGDIGAFVASMLTPDSRYMNGQRIELSGGIYL